ncbi:MAG TPA: Na+/H+ antiporter subunit E [Actinomycetales bacterium]|nr:Na+/H+ antiporter subunit E [Actinomycetales bacterium]
MTGQGSTGRGATGRTSTGRGLPGRIVRAPLVLLWLLWHVVLSAVALSRAALTPGPMGSPVLVRYPMHCRTDVEVTALAWAITVTPGTLVTVIGETDLWVHVILGGPREEMIDMLRETEDRILSVLRAPGDRPGATGSDAPRPDTDRGGPA